MKVAIIYDRVNKWGGAERVLLSLHRIFPKAPLYTSVYDKKNAPWAKVFKVKTSYLQKIPFIKSHNELFPFLMPKAFESFNFDSYDLVISVTSEAAKGVITHGKTIHICLCLTPTRYLWSGFDTYFKNPFLRLVSTPFIFYLKNWDLSASKRPHHYIAISDEVRKRIKKYYGRDARVIYPSIDVKEPKLKVKKGNYFLVVSRLSKYVQYKRVDLVIEVFNKSGRPLKIVGTGSLEKQLKKMAKPNIEFLGKVDDSDLARLYSGARALIFPGMEDFGLVMAEAQSFGTPVIAFRGGGAMEIIKEGKTGEFFNKQEVKSILRVLKKFDKSRYNRKEVIRSANRFSFEIFKRELTNFIKDINKL